MSIVAQEAPTRNTATLEPPQTVPLNLDGIPDDLKALDQWVCWRWEHREGKDGAPKWTKVPVSARTGKPASSTDPRTWALFSVATDFLKRRGDTVHGLGFVFGPDDPFCGIDLDKALDPETKRFGTEVLEIIDRFDSYTEWSISGTGAHIIVRGTVPAGGNRTGRVELYDRGRFFVMSGQAIHNAGVIADRQDELEVWHRELFPEVYAPKVEIRQPLSSDPLSIDDDALLKRCEGSPLFVRLSAGDDSDYQDDASSADLAFLNIIVRNGGDRSQADALYRSSGRSREKWDQRRGEKTYGEMSIDQAFDGTVRVWEPRERQRPHLAVLPPTDDLPDDVSGLKAIIIDLRSRVIAAEERAAIAEAKAEKLSDLQSKTTGIIRNKSLGQERFTAVALAYQLGNREASGDAGDDGLYRMPLARIAESAGISEDAASRHIKKLADEGVLRREVKWVPRTVNRETGEITEPHKALFVGPTSNVTDFVTAVAELEPSKPKEKWGGRRQCAAHPDAPVIKTTTWHCSECGELLDRTEERIEPNPQDADFVDELAATGTDDARSTGSNNSRGWLTTRSGSARSSHNALPYLAPPTQLQIDQAYASLNDPSRRHIAGGDSGD